VIRVTGVVIVKKRNLVSEVAPPIPGHIFSLLGDPPVLSTEDRTSYLNLLHSVAQAVEPKNPIEWTWAKDIVDLSWEIRRLRRFKAELIELQRRSRLDAIEISEEPQYIAPVWPSAAQKKHEERRKTELLTERGSAMAFLDVLTSYEKIDRLLASAETRRPVVLRDIQFYRESLAHLLQKASEIIDAEYEETAITAEGKPRP
jgi:hypothetical protein